MSTNLKLIFGFPVDEWFIYSQQLYYSIKKFCHDPLVLFSSNKGIGYSYDRLKKITSKRKYIYGLINHRFVFDIIEEIKNLDFDYFIKLDSDCLFTNYGFEKLFTEKFDFLNSVDENNKRKWQNSKDFLGNIESYERFISDLKLTRIDSKTPGCLGAFQAYSKKAIDFISGNIKIIEAHPEYAKMEQRVPCLDEVFLFNLLKDAGFEYRTIYLHQGTHSPIRFRPYITTEEVQSIRNSDLPILYHPVKRSLRDKARRVLLKKIGYRYGLQELLHAFNKVKSHQRLILSRFKFAKIGKNTVDETHIS